MGRPAARLLGVVLHRGFAYDDARADLQARLAMSSVEIVWMIKAKDKYTKDCLDSLDLEYLELPSNRDYWGPLAAQWREAEMEYYCEEVLHFYPEKKEVKKHRKGRKPIGV